MGYPQGWDYEDDGPTETCQDCGGDFELAEAKHKAETNGAWTSLIVICPHCGHEIEVGSFGATEMVPAAEVIPF